MTSIFHFLFPLDFLVIRYIIITSSSSSVCPRYRTLLFLLVVLLLFLLVLLLFLLVLLLFPLVLRLFLLVLLLFLLVLLLFLLVLRLFLLVLVLPRLSFWLTLLWLLLRFSTLLHISLSLFLSLSLCLSLCVSLSAFLSLSVSVSLSLFPSLLSLPSSSLRVPALIPCVFFYTLLALLSFAFALIAVSLSIFFPPFRLAYLLSSLTFPPLARFVVVFAPLSPFLISFVSYFSFVFLPSLAYFLCRSSPPPPHLYSRLRACSIIDLNTKIRCSRPPPTPSPNSKHWFTTSSFNHCRI